VQDKVIATIKWLTFLAQPTMYKPKPSSQVMSSCLSVCLSACMCNKQTDRHTEREADRDKHTITTFSHHHSTQSASQYIGSRTGTALPPE